MLLIYNSSTKINNKMIIYLYYKIMNNFKTVFTKDLDHKTHKK
jgi:hypothetical protein